MRIKLIHQQGTHPIGSEHEVVRTVPHGGHTDSERQYVLADGTHVTSDHAKLLAPRPRPHAGLDLIEQRLNAQAAQAAQTKRRAAQAFERADAFLD